MSSIRIMDTRQIIKAIACVLDAEDCDKLVMKLLEIKTTDDNRRDRQIVYATVWLYVMIDRLYNMENTSDRLELIYNHDVKFLKCMVVIGYNSLCEQRNRSYDILWNCIMYHFVSE